jgi:hypothetical protein
MDQDVRLAWASKRTYKEQMAMSTILVIKYRIGYAMVSQGLAAQLLPFLTMSLN